MKRLLGFISMTKPRAMLAVIFTAAAGGIVASRGVVDWRLIVNLVIGTALSGGGSIVFNQLLEREHDRKMERTRARSLPTALVTPREALVWGIALSLIGTGWLFLTVNALTGWLAFLSVVSYAFIYTPLKRITTLNTVVGAVPGAIPPMMGWTAVTGVVSVEAWILFLILFVWQFPHFLAIGWLYREDYGRAGYSMLPVYDKNGTWTARQMVLNAACLLAISIVPASFNLTGNRYALGAVLLGSALLVLTLWFAVVRTNVAARWVMKGSVVHIALLMALLIWDRVI